MRIGDEVYIHRYVDEIRKDTVRKWIMQYYIEEFSYDALSTGLTKSLKSTRQSKQNGFRSARRNK